MVGLLRIIYCLRKVKEILLAYIISSIIQNSSVEVLLNIKWALGIKCE